MGARQLKIAAVRAGGWCRSSSMAICSQGHSTLIRGLSRCWERGQAGAKVLNLPASRFPTAERRAHGFQGAGSPSLPLAARSSLPAAPAKGFYLSPAPPGSQTGSALAAGGGSRCQKTRQHHQEQMERTWHAPSSRLPALSRGCGGSGGLQESGVWGPVPSEMPAPWRVPCVALREG